MPGAICWTFLLLLCLSYLSNSEDITTCKVLADLTTNRLTRDHDGTMGLWSYHGNAHDSHATQTAFTFNGDLIDEDFFHQHIIYHPQIATASHPMLGVTSDADSDYLKYLVLQAKAAGIDGFLVEWGYEGHPSDVILKKLVEVVYDLKPYLKKFCIGINWCEHWLKQHMGNTSHFEMVKVFHNNVQFLLNTLFSPYSDITLFHEGSPVIFLFGGGILPEEFSDVLKLPLKIPTGMNLPIWIGNYLNMASTEMLRQRWTIFLNGTFAWVPHAYRPTPSWMTEWDTYTLPHDAILYQANVSTFATSQVSNGSWSIWAASSCPGEDNRGCAGWGMTLRYLPRFWNGRIMLDDQLRYNLNSSANLLFLPTMNDYSEATVLLPTIEYGFYTLASVLKYTSQWKRQVPDFLGLKQPFLWYILKKKVDFFEKIPNINVTELQLYLQTTSYLLALRKYTNSRNFLNFIQFKLDKTEKNVFSKYIRIAVPSDQMYPLHPYTLVNKTYLVDANHQLFLQMNESTAAFLRADHFQGILCFDYQPKIDNYSILRVESSSSRRISGTSYVNSSSRLLQGDGNKFEVLQGNFSVVCELMEENHKGQWLHSCVELFKLNQSWNHNGSHHSDLSFMVKDTGIFFVKNISLSFYLYSYHEEK